MRFHEVGEIGSTSPMLERLSTFINAPRMLTLPIGAQTHHEAALVLTKGRRGDFRAKSRRTRSSDDGPGISALRPGLWERGKVEASPDYDAPRS